MKSYEMKSEIMKLFVPNQFNSFQAKKVYLLLKRLRFIFLERWDKGKKKD